MKFLLLTKRDPWSKYAGSILRCLSADAGWCLGAVGDPLPQELLNSSGEAPYLLSFLSPWIVPASVLARTKLALNFHPGSTRYPGIGCYNFALYEGASEYGTVVHHMSSRVDSGALLEERLFPVFASDTVESLKLRTMVVMLALFHDIVSTIIARDPLPLSSSEWKRPPFTRRKLNDLAEIRADMTPDEIARRVRATTYPGYPGPSLTMGGVRFFAPVPDRAPLA